MRCPQAAPGVVALGDGDNGLDSALGEAGRAEEEKEQQKKSSRRRRKKKMKYTEKLKQEAAAQTFEEMSTGNSASKSKITSQSDWEGPKPNGIGRKMSESEEESFKDIKYWYRNATAGSNNLTKCTELMSTDHLFYWLSMNTKQQIYTLRAQTNQQLPDAAGVHQMKLNTIRDLHKELKAYMVQKIGLFLCQTTEYRKRYRIRFSGCLAGNFCKKTS